jgi:predicted ferric reductase
LSICLLILLSHPFLRRPSYEIFLRIHQSLALLFAYSVWRHLGLKSIWPKLWRFPQLYVYIFTWMFLCTFLLQLVTITYRNWPVLSRYSLAHITHVNDTVKISLKLSRPLKFEPGQYICLWIPTVSVGAFLQSHPFTITSWSTKKQDSLDLLIQPREGLTKRLLEYSKKPQKVGQIYKSCPAFFTGPHGTSASVEKYETVLMVATGFGIAAQLPYLKKLIYGYNTCTSQTRRVHLVWQLETIGKF